MDVCPFCHPPAERIFYRDSLVIGLWDGFPVTPGHALLIPVRHARNWFDATPEERAALTRATDIARHAIDANFRADGYNIGINSGEAAGQTVFHLHLHVIPRRFGDVADPRGGVRHVIPAKANYLRDGGVAAPYTRGAPVQALVTGGKSDPLLPHLTEHIARSKTVDVAVAFTLRSGLELLQPYLQELLDRDGRLRVLTGDYLGTTDPDALLRLLDLTGQVECRVFETAGHTGPGAFSGSFHPKAYLFTHRDGTAAALIGSSNLSDSALRTGVEWNYRVLDANDRDGLAQMRAAFEVLFQSANTVPLTDDWISAYRLRRPISRPLLPIEVSDEPLPSVPEPHAIQREALEYLRRTREDGRRAGLVVLATGLGKTWLSAFDSLPFKRILFVAHREEILGQSLATYRAIRPHDRLGRYTGQEPSASDAVLFASVQTLSRQVHLERFARDAFDYIIIDEFHHAEARTYRRLIDYFTPTFLLGLTATPERTDGADLLALCDNNLVYRCDMTDGIRAELLCPFRYFGVPDVVDYRNIPWRNKKFDEEALTNAVATQARAQNAFEQWQARGGKRTLAFCVSTRHADFMADFLRDQGIAAVAVHSGATSAPRADSLQKLREGSLAVLCAVDMFNEGVDVPELDTVMMLRPTESRIVWLQQFGRGLRKSSPEKRLTVIDYIGNHRSFMLKPQALFGLPSGDREVLNLLTKLEQGLQELPPGCEVTYELEVKKMFRELLRRGEGAVEVLTRRYQDFRDTLGVRPSAAEMYREGYNPRAMKPAHGSWLGFVRSQDGLSPAEAAAREAFKGFLEALETTEMSKSYKMVTLLAMLNRNALPGALSLDQLGAGVLELGRQHPQVLGDLGTAGADPVALRRLLASQPIPAWCEGRGTGGVPYFAFAGDRLTFTPVVPESAVPAFQDLVRELVDWRLAEYFSRSNVAAAEEHVLRVSRSGEQPMLFLPDRNTHADLPEGWTSVRINGEEFKANFVKVALNVVTAAGADDNTLPALLAGWFGADAGRPGTKHQVVLRREPGGWALQPVVLGAAGGAVPYKAYVRADIPPLFGLRHSEFWRQGFIRQGQQTFLMVTLDKSAHGEKAQYEDHFISPTEFQWQSQNKTAQASRPGESIRDHLSLGIDVHLFVREKAKTAGGRGAPFYYLGLVNFKSWHGDKPITVIWSLRQPVPSALWKELGIPG